MDPAAYNRLVKTLEAAARERPTQLRRGALAFVALGYAYVGAVLIGVLAAGLGIFFLMLEAARGNLLGAKAGFALLVLAWIIVKSLWVSLPPPEGIALDLGSVPALERRLEEIRAALRAPKPHEVLLTMDFNAAVFQRPRFGVFGWPKTYLQLGVPLLYALDVRQLDAVLAHEFAHLSRAHPKTGLWVFRVSRTWQQLLNHLHQSRSKAGWLFKGFFQWYIPRLEARGFVMSRRDEYEADAEAAQIAGADAMGSALIALDVRAHTLVQEFWPELWRRAEHEPTPPTQAWQLFPDRMRTTSITDQAVAKALTATATEHDTHPSLAERLRALGVADVNGVERKVIESLQSSLSTTAADQYLSDRAARALIDADRAWSWDVGKDWSARHKQLTTCRARCTELLDADRNGTLEPTGAWELASALRELGEDATPYLRRIVEATPDHAPAQFLLGRSLLAENDPAGVEHIRAAMKLEVGAVETGAALLRQYYRDRGDHEQAEAAQWDGYNHSKLMREAAEERNSFRERDKLLPPELSEEDGAHIREIGDKFAEIETIWVARKQTVHLEERPMFVMVVAHHDWRRNAWANQFRGLAQRVLESVSLSIRCDVFLMSLESQTHWAKRKMDKVKGARLYHRQ